MLSTAIKNITIGCDPEVFAVDAKGDFVSAHGLIPGSKQEPFPVALGAVQVDGMAFEFNTTPVDTREGFLQNVTGVYGELQQMLPDNLSLVPGRPVAHFTSEVFGAQPEEALELGCDPDYSAYTGGENPRPDASANPFMRTAAGHIHIGWTEGVSEVLEGRHMHECCRLTQLLDALVGLPSLAYDSDAERRALYGKAGAFRPKEYGTEYRVLSNAWLSTPDLITGVYDLVVETTEIFLEGAMIDFDLLPQVQQAINTSDVAAALRLNALIRSDFGL